jgi:hypothetical protein
VHLNGLVDSVVPSTVSYTDFWERFFFKLAKLNEDEDRREALIKSMTETWTVMQSELQRVSLSTHDSINSQCFSLNS